MNLHVVSLRRKDLMMSVAAQLGLDDPAQGLLAQARTEWPAWCGRDPRLAVVDDLLDLPGCIRSADRDDVDEVLHELARLGSPTGGEDIAAAGALAWLLLPGAIQVAHRLRDMTPRIDECVAAQLWIEVRTFAWERRRKVAANIVMNLRRGVLRELGAVEHVRAVDPTWARTMPLAPEADLWRVLDARAAEPDGVEPAEELAELLSWATSQHVIDVHDRELLDLDHHPDAPAGFIQWLHWVLEAHVARGPHGRAALAVPARAVIAATAGLNRHHSLRTSTRAAMEQAVIDDRQAGRMMSRSAWIHEAVAVALQDAEKRAGGTLTPVPDGQRLPNQPAKPLL